jgi:SAM-dependent methyltransferase
MEFVRDRIGPEEVAGRRVLEVGSYDVNGSVRPLVTSFGPTEYVGVDLTRGPGVDEVCEVTRLVDRFGAETFDVVLSTEMLEHVRDWRGAILNMKRVLKPGGVLLLTTRSLGFPYHGYPFDFWRFSLEDMRAIFADMLLDEIAGDPFEPGVFVRARKAQQHREGALDHVALYSIITHRRCVDLSDLELYLFKARHSAAAGALGARSAVWRTLLSALPERASRAMVGWRDSFR